MGAADGGGGGFGEAEMLHLAGGDEGFDGAGDVFDGDLGIDAVLVEEVDAVGAEAGQHGVGDADDVVGAAVEAGGAGAGLRIDVEAEFGGDDDVVADGGEGGADEVFVGPGAVGFGGVEEGDAEVVRAADDADGVGAVGDSP